MILDLLLKWIKTPEKNMTSFRIVLPKEHLSIDLTEQTMRLVIYLLSH